MRMSPEPPWRSCKRWPEFVSAVRDVPRAVWFIRIVSAPFAPPIAECGERSVEAAISEIIIANMFYISRQLPNARVNSIAITNVTSVYSKFSRVFGFRKILRLGKYNRAVTLQCGKPIPK